jgi:hypothetical protein
MSWLRVLSGSALSLLTFSFTHVNSTDYMQALVDDATAGKIVQIRQTAINALAEQNRILPAVLRKNEAKCLDLTEAENHQQLHVSLNEFHNANQAHLGLLGSALTKVIFEVNGVTYSFGKFFVLTLNRQYKIDPTADSGLTPEEATMLEIYMPDKPHISIFKWVNAESVQQMRKDEAGSYILEEKQIFGKTWEQIKLEHLQRMTEISSAKNLSESVKKDKIGDVVKNLLSIVVHSESKPAIVLGDEGSGVSVTNKTLAQQSGKLANLILDQASFYKSSAGGNDEVARSQVLKFLQSNTLFGPIESENNTKVVSRETGSLVSTKNIQTCHTVINDQLATAKVQVKFKAIVIKKLNNQRSDDKENAPPAAAQSSKSSKDKEKKKSGVAFGVRNVNGVVNKKNP